MGEHGTTGEAIGAAFLAGDADGVLGRLAPGAVFHSPVTDYPGEAAAPVLRALAGVLGRADATSTLAGGDETVVAFTGAVGGRPADGMLRVVTPDGGPATDLTLTIRPLKALLAGIEEMKARLAAAS